MAISHTCKLRRLLIPNPFAILNRYLMLPRDESQILLRFSLALTLASYEMQFDRAIANHCLMSISSKTFMSD
jgi:hypothetical protein